MQFPLKEVLVTQPFGNAHFSKKIDPLPLVPMKTDKVFWDGSVYRRPEYGSQIGHNGIDFRAKVGTPVYPIVGGTVVKFRGNEEGYGKYVVIRDEFGGEWTYAHLSEISVEYEAFVRADGVQIIGLSGDSGGRSKTDAHLHVGYRPRGYNAKNGYIGHVDFMDKLQKIAIIQNNKELWHYLAGIYTQEARALQEKLHEANEWLRS